MTKMLTIKNYLLLFLLFFAAQSFAQVIVSDNFDSYLTTQKLGPQAAWWTTWDAVEGTTEDGIVSTEQASSPTKSLKIVSTLAAGGPQDVVLKLNNQTTGRYELKWKMYIPNNKQGYYNLQQVVPIPNPNPTANWTLDVSFGLNGQGVASVVTVPKHTFTYPYATWFEVKHIIDLDNNVLTYFVNNQLVGKIAYPGNLGGVDFYGANNFNQYYIDDVEYTKIPALVYNADNCDAAIDLTFYFGFAAGVKQTTGLQDNTNATVVGTDVAPSCWQDDSNTPTVSHSMWYTFVGDGNNYHIETVPCNATNYIGGQDSPGDTQIGIYEGADCSALTPVDCNEDLYVDSDPATDFRAGLDLQTVPGKNYYMLVDGWSFSPQNFTATGEFCIEVSRVPEIPCDQAVVGTYSLSNGAFWCRGQNLSSIVSIDTASYNLTDVGPISGLSWALTTQKVENGIWPPSLTGAMIVNWTFVVSPYVPTFVNSAANFNITQPVLLYLTPVVMGGGVLIDNTVNQFMSNVDPTNACFVTGESQQIVLMPDLNPIAAFATSTPSTGNNGTITLALEGGIAELAGDPSLYVIVWTGPNGFTSTSQDLTGLAPGTYTAVISDPTGCADGYSLTVDVTTVATQDPSFVKSLGINPNPTNGSTMLSLSMDKAADVQVDVVNLLGQTLHSVNFGKISNLNQALELSGLNEGTYLVRVTMDGQTAVRRLVIQH